MFPPPPPPSPPESPPDDHRPINSLLITGAILLFAVLAILIIHFLLRRRHHQNPNFISPVMTSSPPPSPDPTAVISSLPIFTLSSATKSSPSDCSVCLSPFEPKSQLRLLPGCRHVFHLKCIDTWLESMLTCPLCRSPIEICAEFSLGHSIEHLVGVVEEEEKTSEREIMAGNIGGGSRSWLREYVDRLATSASSSFSSIRSRRRSVEGEEEEELSSFYRWLVGAGS